jgi:D-lactate dehydrogenase (cytochrome)
LGHYRKGLNRLGLFYPPDPTSEDSCAIGGNVACNASGALSYLYGPTRDYIEGLEIALTNGTSLRINRRQIVADQGLFKVPKELFCPTPQSDIIWPAPNLRHKTWRECKNAAGLYSAPNMDLIDLFIGSEGILGVITNIRTRLLPKRKPYLTLMLFTNSRRQTGALVQTLDLFRNALYEGSLDAKEKLNTFFSVHSPQKIKSLDYLSMISPSCMEWYSRSCSRLLSEPMASRLADSYGCVFVEQEYEPDQGPWRLAQAWNEFIEIFNLSLGPDEGEVLVEAALDERRIRQIRDDRLMVPERLNQLISPGMVKIGTDFATPMEYLETVMELYETILPQDISYTFGHIGNAHIHSNIIPRTHEERDSVREMALDLAKKICSMGGTVSAEHGAGKIKHKAMEIMFGQDGLQEMFRIKQAFDPNLILNRHNMFALPPIDSEP